MTLTIFHAEWCNPCKLYKGTFNKVSQEFKDKLEVMDLDVDEVDEEVLKKYGIRSVPSTVLTDDEEVLLRLTGNISESELRDALSSKIS